MTGVQELIAIAVGVTTLLGAVGAFWVKVLKPRIEAGRKEATAVRDAILGREPITDSITGREIAPALPGIGQRMATVEQALVTLADQGRRLGDLEDEQIDHGERLDKLEAAQVERVVTRAESTAAWRAMEAAVQAEPDQEAGP
ncbi:MAG: hypothetical protein CMJ18_07800 [Phycisphaeraceae bacterium]|nr:hypothetical protein [Phycisphaeraceae bacterium]